MFTARYGLIPYIKQIRLVFKRLLKYSVFISWAFSIENGVYCTVCTDIYRCGNNVYGIFICTEDITNRILIPLRLEHQLKIFLLSYSNCLFHFVASSPTNDEHSNLFHCQEPVFVRWLQTLTSVQHSIMLFCYSFAFCFRWCWMSAFTSNYKLRYDTQTKLSVA